MSSFYERQQAKRKAAKQVTVFPIKFKPDWVVQFRLDQPNNALSLVITSGKGELYGHISIVQKHGDDHIELFDYAEAARYPECDVDAQRYYLSSVEEFQEYLDDNIA